MTLDFVELGVSKQFMNGDMVEYTTASCRDTTGEPLSISFLTSLASRYVSQSAPTAPHYFPASTGFSDFDPPLSCLILSSWVALSRCDTGRDLLNTVPEQHLRLLTSLWLSISPLHFVLLLSEIRHD